MKTHSRLKEITDAAVAQCPAVEKVFVFKRTGEAVPYTEGRERQRLLSFPRPLKKTARKTKTPRLFLYFKEVRFRGKRRTRVHNPKDI